MLDKPTIAIAIGDPAGIGPEISLKAALDPAVRNACKAIMVGESERAPRIAAGTGVSGWSCKFN